jgi:hypothetical protein
MARRSSVELELGGGIHRSGDAVKAPVNTSTESHNVFLRPGPRVEKRPGWLGFSAQPTVDEIALLVKTFTASAELLAFIGDVDSGVNPSQSYQFDGTTWTEINDNGSDVRLQQSDAVHAFDKLWLTGIRSVFALGYSTGITFSWDPTNSIGASLPWMGEDLSGSTIDSAINRLFIGNIIQAIHHIVTPTLWETGGSNWTLTGLTRGSEAYTVDPWLGVRLQYFFTVALATDQAQLDTGYTTTAETQVSWAYDLKPAEAVSRIPLTFKIMDTAGVVYAQEEYDLPTQGEQPGWERRYLIANVPTGKQIRLRMELGNTATPTVVAGTRFYVAAQYSPLVFPKGKGTNANRDQIVADWDASNYGITRETAPSSSSLSIVTNKRRIMWSETDDPYTWLTENFYDCIEEPAPITAIRSGHGKLAAYKSNSIYLFTLTDNPDLPILFQTRKPAVGCVGPKAISSLDGRHLFIGEHNVYSWDLEGDPEALVGPGLREEMFDQDTMVDFPVLEVDSDNGEVWVYTQPGLIYVYSLGAGGWTTIDARDSSGTALEVRDLLYCQPSTTSYRAMWAALSNKRVVRLTIGQLRDEVVVGATRAIDATQAIHAIESPHPRATMFIEGLELDHEITASQSNSTLTAAIAVNGSPTFTSLTPVRVTPVTADGDAQPIKLPIQHSARKAIIKVTHSGDGTPEAFNLTGGTLHLNVRGRAKLDNPSVA